MDEAALDFEDCLHDADAWQQALSAGAFDEPPVVVVAAVEAGEVYGGEHWRPRSRPFAELTQQHQPAPVCGLSLSPPALGVETAAWHCTLTGAELPRPSGGALLPELSMPPNCSGIRRRLVGNLGPSRRAWSPFSAVGHYQSHLSQSSEHQSYARGVEILVPAGQHEVFLGHMDFRRKHGFIYRRFRHEGKPFPRAGSDSQEVHPFWVRRDAGLRGSWAAPLWFGATPARSGDLGCHWGLGGHLRV